MQKPCLGVVPYPAGSQSSLVSRDQIRGAGRRFPLGSTGRRQPHWVTGPLSAIFGHLVWARAFRWHPGTADKRHHLGRGTILHTLFGREASGWLPRMLAACAGADLRRPDESPGLPSYFATWGWLPFCQPRPGTLLVSTRRNSKMRRSHSAPLTVPCRVCDRRASGWLRLGLRRWLGQLPCSANK